MAPRQPASCNKDDATGPARGRTGATGPERGRTAAIAAAVGLRSYTVDGHIMVQVHFFSLDNFCLT